MKLGLSMFIVGVLLAGVGVAAWTYADPNTSIWIGGPLGVEEAMLIDAVGVGAMVIGGGLAIGGLVRMIVTRRSR